jgi:nickel-dependent lactate racemase
MMQFVKVPQLPMEGPKDLLLRLPEHWDVSVHNMNGWNRPAVPISAIVDSLRNPLGTPPLRELAKGKKEVVILFDDYTRGMKWNTIAQAVLAELASAGITDDQIRFICALGTHGVATRTVKIQKLGEDIVSRYRVYNHNAFSLENAHLGKTKTWGVDVYANPEVMACDLKIALGAVTPHPINGFGGGSKIVLPGILSYDSISTHHDKSFDIAFTAMNDAMKAGVPSKVGLGIYDAKDHPAIDVDDEAAAMVGLDFTVNVIANGLGEPVGIWSGDVAKVFVEALTDGKDHYATVPAEEKDIVIANAFYKANEPMIALTSTPMSVKKSGGTMVLVANTPEGITTHYYQGNWGATPKGRPPAAQAINIAPNVDQLIVYNEYPDPGASWWIEPPEKIVTASRWDDVLELLQKRHPKSASVAVYPNADFQYMRAPDGNAHHHDIPPPH